MIRPDDARHDRRNTGSREATDWDAYDRVQWHRSDTLDPELRRHRIPLALLIALCIRAGRPVVRRAA